MIHIPPAETHDTAIVQINKAELALSRANDIHEMIELRSYGAAAEMLANARGFRDAAQQAKIFQLKAERKAGAWLAENVGSGEDVRWHEATALPEGVDKYESSRWQLEASLPEENFNDWIDSSLAHGHEITAGALRVIARNYAGKYIAPATPLQRAVAKFLLEAEKVQTELTPAQAAAAEAVKREYGNV